MIFGCRKICLFVAVNSNRALVVRKAFIEFLLFQISGRLSHGHYWPLLNEPIYVQNFSSLGAIRLRSRMDRSHNDFRRALF
jgi:hypothetical protein